MASQRASGVFFGVRLLRICQPQEIFDEFGKSDSGFLIFVLDYWYDLSIDERGD